MNIPLPTWGPLAPGRFLYFAAITVFFAIALGVLTQVDGAYPQRALAVHNDGLFQLDYTTSPAQGAANARHATKIVHLTFHIF